jgi:predicted Zn-dependent peptidase
MTRILIRNAAVAWVLVVGLVTPIGAQQPSAPTLDRTVAPPAAPEAPLRFPQWTQSPLANGATLVVSERRSLPLVAVTIEFIGGADQYEPANEAGLASFVASMLSEGTTTRTGDQISNAIQSLGGQLGTSIAGETGSIRFSVMKDKLQPMLDLVNDVMLHPTFPADALERLRARSLVGLAQQRDRTSGIANVVFPKLLYTTSHPYGRSPTEASLKAITRGDLEAFHRMYFTPGHATITVVGDVSATDVKRMVEHAFADWPAGGSVPAFTYPAPPAPGPTTIYLVDKPGAAQSTFAIGAVGPPRNTPDYVALRVLNSFFGEQFQSRLNADIRERKGYSYGVFSRFAYGRGPGPFQAGGDIVTAKTDSALIEFMSQLRGIRGGQPITDDEMTAAKNALIQSLPAQFASDAEVNAAITTIYANALPRDYYQNFVKQVNAVTKEDVLRVARKYIDPDHLAILIVGDRATIERPLAATGIAPVVRLNVEGERIE